MNHSPTISISFPSPKPAHGYNCSCKEARKQCVPPFVFSISGQVGFRQALYHVTTCKDPECRRLKVKIVTAMRKKLNWLLKEDVLLGCIYLQPYIYGVNKTLLTQENFKAIAHHLAHCPKEACAQLRRSSLLTVRRTLNPKSSRTIDQQIIEGQDEQ